MRRALFQQRLSEVEAHNSESQRQWTAGINHLSDWTESELKSLLGWDGSVRPEGGSRSARPHRAFLQKDDERDSSDLPDDKLWDTETTRHVRNQGSCGSCWAIAVSTVLEAHAEIYGHARTFSAQQIVECTPNPRSCGGTGGCGGATAELAMDWIMKNGVAEESDVPYLGRDGTCGAAGDSAPNSNDAGLQMVQLRGPEDDMEKIFSEPTATVAAAAAPVASAISPEASPITSAVSVHGTSVTSDTAATPSASPVVSGLTGWETLPKNTYEPLLRALAERGPVAVSVGADSWFNYHSGIFNGCGRDSVIDHAVTAIGYGQEAGTKYWVIQNSWGAGWGEAGKIRLERHSEGGYCGMDNDPQKGLACKGENDPVPVCGMCGILFDSVVPHFQH